MSRCVLVVDDDPSIQTVLVRLLQKKGFVASGAATIADATSVAEGQDVDAVILDLGLHGGTESGIDFLAWLRRQPRFAETPVLILTGQARLTPEEEAVIREQHAHVFYKPQPFAPLVEFLSNLSLGPG